MTMLDCPDDVFRTECRVAAEENAGQGALHRLLIDYRNIPLVELDAEVAFNPRKRILLADGEDYVICGECEGIESFRPFRLGVPFKTLELHADELTVLE